MNDLRAAAEMNAFYIVPANAKKSLLNLFSTHPPVEQRIAELSRLEAQLQGARCGTPPTWGSSTPARATKVKASGAGPAVRAHHRVRHARDRARASRRAGRRRSSSSRSPPPTSSSIVTEMEELVRGTGEETGTTLETARRRVRLPLDDPPRPRRRGPRRRDQRGQRRAGGRRLRRPDARRGLRVQGRTRPAAVPDLQLQARHLVPVRARRRASKQRDTERELQLKAKLEPSCPSRRSSSAGSRCGVSRSDDRDPREGPQHPRRRPRPRRPASRACDWRAAARRARRHRLRDERLRRRRARHGRRRAPRRDRHGPRGGLRRRSPAPRASSSTGRTSDVAAPGFVEPDSPAVHREAHAIEGGTIVLAVGAAPASRPRGLRVGGPPARARARRALARR